MNVFGWPHWQISQHFPITLTFITGTNYRSTWHPLHMGARKWHFLLLLSQYVLYLCHRKPKGNEHKLLLSVEIEEGMLKWWMSFLQTEMKGKPMCLCIKSSMTVAAPLRTGAKCTTEHIQRSSTKSLCNTPASYWCLFQIETAYGTTFHFTHLMCVDRKLAHLNPKEEYKMEENDAHLLNRAHLNHHLLLEIAPVVNYAPYRLT